MATSVPSLHIDGGVGHRPLVPAVLHDLVEPLHRGHVPVAAGPGPDVVQLAIDHADDGPVERGRRRAGGSTPASSTTEVCHQTKSASARTQVASAGTSTIPDTEPSTSPPARRGVGRRGPRPQARRRGGGGRAAPASGGRPATGARPPEVTVSSTSTPPTSARPDRPRQACSCSDVGAAQDAPAVHQARDAPARSGSAAGSSGASRPGRPSRHRRPSVLPASA